MSPNWKEHATEQQEEGQACSLTNKQLKHKLQLGVSVSN